MLHLTINKQFLENYRQYKLDLIESDIEEDFEYKALTHIINNGQSLSDLLDKVEEIDRITIDVKSGSIVHESLNTQQMVGRMKRLAGIKKL